MLIIAVFSYTHICIHTYITMSLQLGNERHDILVVGIKQAAIYVLYMVNLKLPSNVLNHILLLLWGRGSKLCIYLLHSVVKILKYLVMCSLEVGGSWNNMPIITLCRRFEIGHPCCINFSFDNHYSFKNFLNEFSIFMMMIIMIVSIQTEIFPFLRM